METMDKRDYKKKLIKQIKGGIMNISAVFCKSCHNIIYSRAPHDYRTCDCGKASIDGGFDLTRIVGNPEDFIRIELDGKVVLEQIMYYDYLLGNRNAGRFPNGYYGKYWLNDGSNFHFYNRLIISDNKNEVLEVIE